MSYPQGPQQGPGNNRPSNNPFNGNPFNRNNNGGNSGQNGNGNGQRPFWQSPWLWGVLVVLIAIGSFQIFAGSGTQTIDTKDGFALLKNGTVSYAKIIDNTQLVKLELTSDYTKTDPDTGRQRNYGKDVQFYYTFAQGAQVVQAVEKANPSKGWTSDM